MNERIEKIKTHFKENKKVYIGTSIGFVVGGVGVLLSNNTPTMVKVQEIMNIKYKSPTIVQLILAALGDPGNVVQCDETGTIYASQGQAAKELGVSPAMVSKHLNGNAEHVGGKHLKKLGKAGQPIDLPAA